MTTMSDNAKARDAERRLRGLPPGVNEDKARQYHVLEVLASLPKNKSVISGADLAKLTGDDKAWTAAGVLAVAGLVYAYSDPKTPGPKSFFGISPAGRRLLKELEGKR